MQEPIGPFNFTRRRGNVRIFGAEDLTPRMVDFAEFERLDGCKKNVDRVRRRVRRREHGLEGGRKDGAGKFERNKCERPLANA